MPNTVLPERLPWNNLSQNWKYFFSGTTKIGQYQSMKNLYKQRSKCSIIFQLFDPLTIALFSGTQIQWLRVMRVSYVWIMLYWFLSVVTSMLGLENVASKAVFHCLQLYTWASFSSLFLTFSIFDMGINQPPSHRVNERVTSIIRKRLKIVLTCDENLTCLTLGRGEVVLFSPS